MTKTLILLLSFVLFSSLWAQVPYLDPMFSVHRDTLQYGSDLNYRGCTEDLFLDLYKPVNQLTERPLMVLVHGGGFVNGSRQDASIVKLADSLASRGFVVASIDYRKGFHHRNVSGSLGCVLFQTITGLALTSCEYPADSSEVIRALYRANQDAKAAVRFLRNRSVMDSSSKENVFLGGESAGAISAMQMAFWDKASEKPLDAGALPDAPNSPNIPCTKNNPCGVALPGDLSRPDLGGIDGNINLNGESSQVKAVVSIYGAILDPTILQNDSGFPALYFYHQSCDPVVDCQRDRLLHDMSNCIYYCSGCPGLALYPQASGSCALIRDIVGGGFPVGSMYIDTVSNGHPINSYFGCFGVDQTVPYCTNSNFHGCHSIAYTHQRVQSIANFLYPCLVHLSPGPQPSQLQVYPNPAVDHLNLTLAGQSAVGFSWELYNLEGKIMRKGYSAENQAKLHLEGLPKGTYLMKVSQDSAPAVVQKIMLSGR